MATCPQPLSVQDGVRTERKNSKLKTASAGRKNGEPLIVTCYRNMPSRSAFKNVTGIDRVIWIGNVINTQTVVPICQIHITTRDGYTFGVRTIGCISNVGWIGWI